MKIAMIGHKEFPSRSGGVEVVVYGLATRLARRGHDVTVYNRGKSKNGNVYQAEGVTVRRVFTFRREALNAMVYSFLATFDALRRGYDVIHYHAIGPSVPIFLCRLFGRRTVCTVHGLNWRCDKWGGFASAYLKLGEKVAAKYADELVVLSEDARQYFWEHYHRQATLIGNGIDPIQPAAPDRITRDFQLKKGGYLLYVGRLSAEKGLMDLLDGFERSGVNLRLVLAGPLQDSAYCQEIRRRASRDSRIVLTGFADLSLLRELYTNCALFVLPSHTEGLPLVLLEAMSSGANCLVSDIPENTGVLNGFGSAFSVGNPDDLAKAIPLALAKQRPADLVQRQKDWIVSHYGYDAVVDRYEQAYQRACQGRRKEGRV